MNVLYTDDDAFADKRWRDYFKLMVTMKQDFGHVLSSTNWQEFKSAMVAQTEQLDVCDDGLFVKDDRAAGFFYLGIHHRGKEGETPFAGIDGPYTVFPEKLVRAFVIEAKKFLQKYNLQSVPLHCEDERTVRLANEWGLKMTRSSQEFVLDRESARRAPLREWIQECTRKNDDLRFGFFDFYPDESLEQLAELETMGVQAVPEENASGISPRITVDDLRNENTWRRKENRPIYTAALWNSSNLMVAMSQAGINANNPISAYQFMTTVREEYRGQGLAKWLKAAVYLQLRELYPQLEEMRTEMSAINEPIQHINNGMGFRLIRSGGTFTIVGGRDPF